MRWVIAVDGETALFIMAFQFAFWLFPFAAVAWGIQQLNAWVTGASHVDFNWGWLVLVIIVYYVWRSVAPRKTWMILLLYVALAIAGLMRSSAVQAQRDASLSRLTMHRTVVATGIEASTAIHSPRFHEIVLGAEFKGKHVVVIVNALTNHVAERLVLGDSDLSGFTLDEPRHRVYGTTAGQSGADANQLWGIDLVTRRVVFHAMASDSGSIGSYDIDSTTGAVFMTVSGGFSGQTVFQAYARGGHLLYSHQVTGEHERIRSIDGTHHRIILTGDGTADASSQIVARIYARDTRSGRQLWALPLAYDPSDVACDDQTGQAVLLQSGGVALLNMVTHRFARHISGGDAGTTLVLDEPMGTGLVFGGSAIDFLNLKRHTLRTASGIQGRLLETDLPRHLAFVIYQTDDTQDPVVVAGIDMRTGLTMGRWRVPGLTSADQALAGDDHASYVAETPTTTDPNTQVQTTAHLLTMYRPQPDPVH